MSFFFFSFPFHELHEDAGSCYTSNLKYLKKGNAYKTLYDSVSVSSPHACNDKCEWENGACKFFTWRPGKCFLFKDDSGATKAWGKYVSGPRRCPNEPQA